MAVDVVLIKLGEIELEVEGVYVKEYAGVVTFPNGDPGVPGEPSDFEITNVFYGGTDITDLLSETDILLMNQVSPEDKLKYGDIWSILTDKCVESYEKTID